MARIRIAQRPARCAVLRGAGFFEDDWRTDLSGGVSPRTDELGDSAGFGAPLDCLGNPVSRDKECPVVGKSVIISPSQGARCWVVQDSSPRA